MRHILKEMHGGTPGLSSFGYNVRRKAEREIILINGNCSEVEINRTTSSGPIFDGLDVCSRRLLEIYLSGNFMCNAVVVVFAVLTACFADDG